MLLLFTCVDPAVTSISLGDDGHDGDCDGVTEAPEGWLSATCSSTSPTSWLGLLLIPLLRRNRR